MLAGGYDAMVGFGAIFTSGFRLSRGFRIEKWSELTLDSRFLREDTRCTNDAADSPSWPWDPDLQKQEKKQNRYTCHIYVNIPASKQWNLGQVTSTLDTR